MTVRQFSSFFRLFQYFIIKIGPKRAQTLPWRNQRFLVSTNNLVVEVRIFLQCTSSTDCDKRKFLDIFNFLSVLIFGAVNSANYQNLDAPTNNVSLPSERLSIEFQRNKLLASDLLAIRKFCESLVLYPENEDANRSLFSIAITNIVQLHHTFCCKFS